MIHFSSVIQLLSKILVWVLAFSCPFLKWKCDLVGVLEKWKQTRLYLYFEKFPKLSYIAGRFAVASPRFQDFKVFVFVLGMRDVISIKELNSYRFWCPILMQEASNVWYLLLWFHWECWQFGKIFYNSFLGKMAF